MVGPNTVDGVRPIEVLDRRPLRDAQLRVAAPHLGVLPGNPVVEADAVVVAALDHEWARCDAHGHLRIIERRAELPLLHLLWR